MTATGQIRTIDFLIGRVVLARETANRLGQIYDLIVDPLKGTLGGLAVRMPDQSLSLIDAQEIYSFGVDAVMINSDLSAMSVQDSPLKYSPLARTVMMGAKVLTEGGKLLGQIANIYIHLAPEEESPLFYEVRSSLLDKLLGHTLYFPASWGRALSQDGKRLVVADDTPEKADHTLHALETRLYGPPPEPDPIVTVRSRSH
jgi:sporulation protein YlmC with PRC-barrel domain